MITNKDGRNLSVRTKDELKKMVSQTVEGMSDDEKLAFEQILEDVSKGDTSLLDLLNETDYEHELVSMEQFLEDPYYFGNPAETLYPQLKADLIEMFSGEYHEAILSGSIGWGKTFTSSLAMGRIIYELSCLRSPQSAYGLSSGSTIAIVGMSVNEKLAKKVIFEGIGNMIFDSPYFMEHFKPARTQEELRFPKNVWVSPGSTSDNSVLGLNVMSAVMDETNFMGTPQNKETVASHARWGHIDNAELIYAAIMRRMKSRYMRQGKLPGMLMLVSSKKTATDFTERRIREAQEDPHVFVREYAMYTVKPRHFFMAEEFKVLVGNEQMPSKILIEPDEIKRFEASEKHGVLNVPEDFRMDFERDLDAAMRDIAGIATVAIYPYIRKREKIEECVDDTREHPMDVVEFQMDAPGNFLWNKLVVDTGEYKKPIHHSKLGRHIHIDTSLTGDSTGIAMGCVVGYSDVVRTGLDGKKYVESAPHYHIDLMIRIVPPLGGEIIFSDVRNLIYEMSGNGFHIAMVTLDSYQSFDFKQTLERQGYRAEIVSVDTKLEPYEMLRDAIYENRISYYRYEPFLDEARRLELHQARKKVDHPIDGSKDVSDAVAGIVYSLSQMYVGEPLSPVALMSDLPMKESKEDFGWVSGYHDAPTDDDDDDDWIYKN